MRGGHYFFQKRVFFRLRKLANRRTGRAGDRRACPGDFADRLSIRRLDGVKLVLQKPAGLGVGLEDMRRRVP